MHGLCAEPEQYPGVVLPGHVFVLEGHHNWAEALVESDQIDVLLLTKIKLVRRIFIMRHRYTVRLDFSRQIYQR